jgi:hypothetical protein
LIRGQAKQGHAQYPNVHFFQGAYAIIVLWTVIRTTYLLQTRLLSTPAEIRMNQAIRRVAWQGFALYVRPTRPRS